MDEDVAAGRLLTPGTFLTNELGRRAAFDSWSYAVSAAPFSIGRSTPGPKAGPTSCIFLLGRSSDLRLIVVISALKGELGGRVKAKTKFGIGIGIILVSLSALAWIGAKQSQTYYHTIAELSSLDASALHQRIRIGGDVAAGSIKQLPGRIDFVLTEEGRTLPVSYVGTDPLPDTFKDGAQCLIEGHAMPDGRFVAEQLQAKCASKYEAAPGGTESSQPVSSSDRKS
jgi:cytochrome c-type biogenesis protein CcmE